MLFLPNDDKLEAQSKAIFEEVAKKEGLTIVGWRSVPVKHEVVGRFAKETQPRIAQVLVQGKPGQVGDELEREMFILRKLVEKEKAKALPADVAPDFYICTLSNRTIVYKVSIRRHRVHGRVKGGHRVDGRVEGGHRVHARVKEGHRVDERVEGGHRVHGRVEGGHRVYQSAEGLCQCLQSVLQRMTHMVMCVLGRVEPVTVSRCVVMPENLDHSM